MDKRTEFQRLIEPLLERSAGYALSILRHRADAEDAIQEAALKGCQALDRYDGVRPLKGWWFAILRNCCLDTLRRRARAAGELRRAEDIPAREAPAEDEELYRALAGVSPAHRAILQLRYFGGLSYREIAEALAIPEGTVMSRLHAARQALAQIYRVEE